MIERIQGIITAVVTPFDDDENIREKAGLYSKNVVPYLEVIRDHIDHLELIVDNEIWPLPKYRELLFVR